MEYTRLEDINQYKGEGINPLKTPDKIFELYSVPEFDSGRPEVIKGRDIGSSKATVKKNDILLCKINPRINRVWVVGDYTEYQSIASSEWIVVRNNEYNPEYLAWYFRTPRFKKLMTSQVTGIGGSLTRAQPKQVKKYPVPVLNRNEQDEVVNVLNKADEIIALKKKELEQLDTLIKARFVEMFGDPIINNRNWKTLPLQEVCEGIGDGLHGTPTYDENGKIPFINGNNLDNGRLVITQSTKMVDEGTYLKNYIDISSNAVLVSINGSLGRLAFFNNEKVMLGKSVCYCNLKSYMNRSFVYALMSSEPFKHFLESNSTKSTIKNVGLKAMREFRIIIPPEMLQREFSAFVSQVDKSKSVVQKSLDETQVLFDSLMQKYFG